MDGVRYIGHYQLGGRIYVNSEKGQLMQQYRAKFWEIYRRVSYGDQCAQISYSRGVSSENQQNGHPPFWFYGESIRNRDGKRT